MGKFLLIEMTLKPKSYWLSISSDDFQVEYRLVSEGREKRKLSLKDLLLLPSTGSTVQHLFANFGLIQTAIKPGESTAQVSKSGLCMIRKAGCHVTIRFLSPHLGFPPGTADIHYSYNN